MTDSEKIAVIDTMIADYWEWLPVDREKRSADTLVVAIAAVINFERKE